MFYTVLITASSVKEESLENSSNPQSRTDGGAAVPKAKTRGHRGGKRGKKQLAAKNREAAEKARAEREQGGKASDSEQEAETGEPGESACAPGEAEPVQEAPAAKTEEPVPKAEEPVKEEPEEREESGLAVFGEKAEAVVQQRQTPAPWPIPSSSPSLKPVADVERPKPSSASSSELQSVVQDNYQKAQELLKRNEEIRNRYLACPPEKPPEQLPERPRRPPSLPPPPPPEWYEKVAKKKRAASASARERPVAKPRTEVPASEYNSFQPLTDEWQSARQQLREERVARRSACAPETGGASSSSSHARPSVAAQEEELFVWEPSEDPIRDIRDGRNRVGLNGFPNLDPRLVALDWNGTIAFGGRVPESSYRALARLLYNGFIIQVVSYIGLTGPQSDKRRAELPDQLEALSGSLRKELGNIRSLPIKAKIVSDRKHKVPYCSQQNCHILVDDNEDIVRDAKACGFQAFYVGHDRKTKAGKLSSVMKIHSLESSVEEIIRCREEGWHLPRDPEDPLRKAHSWKRKS